MAGRAPVVPKKPKANTIPLNQQVPLEEQIRQRAHQIFLERGGQDGGDMDDWLQAEQEVLAQQEPGNRAQ
jgi:hypothetical protein